MCQSPCQRKGRAGRILRRRALGVGPGDMGLVPVQKPVDCVILASMQPFRAMAKKRALLRNGVDKDLHCCCKESNPLILPEQREESFVWPPSCDSHEITTFLKTPLHYHDTYYHATARASTPL